MEPRRKNADSFGTFLEILQGKTSEAQSSDHAVLRLLTVLEGTGPSAVSELWPKTGLELTPFVAALKTAKDGGFVKSTGTADAEVVEVTDSGVTVAALARGGR
jgi:ABC-type nitrate/sulfonate/bicarbonate transport system substrate-binding protein